MPEIRINIPGRDDFRRWATKARSAVDDVSMDDVKGAATRARERAVELGKHGRDKGGEFFESVRDEGVRINWLEARKLDQVARERLATAQDALQAEHDRTVGALTNLGLVELEAFDGPIRHFVGLFSRMKNVEISDVDLEGAPEATQELDVELEDVDLKAIDAFKAAVAGGGLGAAAGATTFAAVGTFAAASTGTAISTLGGAAATNATLAWLGGGSLAAGGGGVAAGTAVLGGIVALPVLAVGGFVMHKKGVKALANAQANELEVDRIAADLAAAETGSRAIRERSERVHQLIDRMQALAHRRNGVLEHLVDRNDDYATYDEQDREAVMVSVAVMKTLRALIDVRIIDEGVAAADGDEALVAGEEVLAEWAA